MILTALRLQEVGPFLDGVCLTGLSPGLNLLAGPNERGKSTLLRALQAVFREPYSATNKAVRALRSYHGGAPMIEVEFQLGQDRWLLRKQFLAGKSALLMNLDTQTRWRNADAENQLESLVGETTAMVPDGLLWVAQTKSFSMPEGRQTANLSASLAAFIEQEATLASGGGKALKVRELIAERLGELVTEKTLKPRKGGALAKAQDEFAALEVTLGDVDARFELYRDKHRRLQELITEERALANPERGQRMIEERAQANAAFEAARVARERLDALHYKAQAAQATLDAKTKQFDDLQSRQKQISQLKTRLGKLQEQIEVETATVVRLQELGQQGEACLQDLRRKMAEAETSLQRLVADEAYQAALSAASELEARLARAKHAEAEAHQLNEEIAGLSVSDARVEQARDLAVEGQRLAALQDAQAATIGIQYEPDPGGVFEIDGRSLSEGETIVADQPVEIVVGGVGRLAVRPGNEAEHARLTNLREANRDALKTLLAQMGVSDVAEASRLLVEKHHLMRRADAATAMFSALAPDGLAALETELANVRPSPNGDPAGPVISETQAEVKCRIAELGENLKAQHGALETLQGDIVAARLREQHTRSSIENAEQQLQVLVQDAELDDDAQGALLREVQAAQAFHVDAHRTYEDWAAACPDGQTLEQLQQEVDRHRTLAETTAQSLKDVQLEIAAIEGHLEADREADIAFKQETLTAAFREAGRRLDDIQLEADALQLLLSELDRAAGEKKGRVLQPVLDRAQPLITELLGDGAVHLDGPLSVTGLKRGRSLEPLAQLSDGTREQISVLVRLAYARLFADRGHAIPIILDDALVFSDDERLSTLFDLLSRSAMHHQVLIFTCHDRAFEPLVAQFGGKRLALSAWGSVNPATLDS